MSEIHIRRIEPVVGIAAREAGSFLAQLDDQNRRLTEDTRGLTPDDLSWQPHPGMNTIGMLFAHLAIVEVYWLLVATESVTDDFEQRVRSVIGIGPDDDGMPAAADTRPPTTLAGKDLAFYDDLLARARRHTRAIVQSWSEADLDGMVERVSRRDGSRWQMNRRWILYHVLEHLAGHYGQINLLRHLQRARAATGVTL